MTLRDLDHLDIFLPPPAVNPITRLRPAKKSASFEALFFIHIANEQPFAPTLYASSTIFLKKLARAAPSPVLRSTVSPLRI